MNIYELNYDLKEDTIKVNTYISIEEFDDNYFVQLGSNIHRIYKKSIITYDNSIKDTLCESEYFDGVLYFLDIALCDKYASYIFDNRLKLLDIRNLKSCKYELERTYNHCKRVIEKCISDISDMLDR